MSIGGQMELKQGDVTAAQKNEKLKAGRIRAFASATLLTAGLALGGVGAYFAYMKGYDAGAAITSSQSRAKETAFQIPAPCTDELIDKLAERVQRNLKNELEYWKEPVRGENPRLLVELESFLAGRGVTLESGIEVRLKNKIEALKMSENVLVGDFFIMDGLEVNGRVLISYGSLMWVPSTEINEMQRATRELLTHEILHYLAIDFAQFGREDECSYNDEETSAGFHALMEGFTAYLSGGIMEQIGPKVAVGYPDGVCVIKKISENQETLKALVKLFFMSDTERPLRKDELNRAILKVKKQLNNFAPRECNLVRGSLIKGADALLNAGGAESE